MTKQGLTDLERGKYLPDGNNQYSVVRVAQVLDTGGFPGDTTSPNYVWQYFQTSGGSREQNIDGSVTPVDFEITFATKTYVKRIDFVACSVNIVSTLDYGSIAGGLPNGIQMIKKVGATETVLFNCQRWIEYGHFVDDQLGQIEHQENPTEDIVIASCTFVPLWRFEAGTKLITRIRDNLSILRYHRTSILAVEP